MSDSDLRELERTIRLEPADPELHERHGRLLLRLGRRIGAASAFDVARRLRGDSLAPKGWFFKKRPAETRELSELLDALARDVLGVKMRLVPGGPFLMGSPEGEGDEDEKPRHLVWLSPFLVATHVLSWPADPVARMNEPGSLFPQPAPGKSPVRPLPFSGLPVCAKSVLETARTLANEPALRLPTEAEWERARLASEDHGLVIGNVPEWCEDLYDTAAYDRELPTGARCVDPLVSKGEQHAVRGTGEALAFLRRPCFRDSARDDTKFEERETETHLICMRLVLPVRD